MPAPYRLTEHARLDARNTFGVRATAPMLVEVSDATALPELFGYAMLRDPGLLILGGGSNLLFAAHPTGAVLSLQTQQITLQEDNGAQVRVRADAGVVWHDFVLWTLGHGFSGLETHFVRALVSDLLTTSYSSIDCFLYITLNRYVEVAGSDIPRLLWMPSYSERAPDSLVLFVDDLGRKWFDFLESKIGPFSIPREEVPQGNNEAGILLSRAIVLPSEKR